MELSVQKYSFVSFQTSNGTYTGFIKVNLRLSRPVTVSDGALPSLVGPSDLSTSTSECLDERDSERTDKRTSFYLPSDSVTQLHISSGTTTREVIRALLKKFMVLDNPCKFALYKQMHRDGQGGKTWSCLKKTSDSSLFIISFAVVVEPFFESADLFQKLPLNERPLLLRLIAGPDLERLSFVLKENETGEVEVRNYLSENQVSVQASFQLSQHLLFFTPFLDSGTHLLSLSCKTS